MDWPPFNGVNGLFQIIFFLRIVTDGLLFEQILKNPYLKKLKDKKDTKEGKEEKERRKLQKEREEKERKFQIVGKKTNLVEKKNETTRPQLLLENEYDI